MDEDWTRAAAAVEARLAELRMDRTALAKAAGVDRKTVDNFLDRGMKPRTNKRGGYEFALSWGYGSLLGVARGGQPDVWSPDPQERLREAARRLAAGQEELAEENARPEGEIDRRSVAELAEAGLAPLLSLPDAALRGLSEEQQAVVIREAQEAALRTARLLRGDR